MVEPGSSSFVVSQFSKARSGHRDHRLASLGFAAPACWRLNFAVPMVRAAVRDFEPVFASASYPADVDVRDVA
jgi:hypothetical protein